jgi:hypothetical protein
MRKDELIKALIKVLPGAVRTRRKRSSSHASKSSKSVRQGALPHVNGHAEQVSTNHCQVHSASNGARTAHFQRTFRNQSSRILKPAAGHNHTEDSLFAEPHDSHWIFARWAISRPTMQRAETALGFEWRQAIPVLRVFDVTSSDAETVVANWVRDVEIHGEVQSWYVPVEDAPRAYRLHIGYLTPSGQFFVLARSNVVKTPRPGTLAHNGATKRNGTNACVNGKRSASHGDRNSSKHANGSNGHSRHAFGVPTETKWLGEFPFEVHAELVVHGTTHPQAKMTLLGEEVPLEADGSFSLRLALPDGRQVIPAVAVTPNGAEQRTIVLGVERNTRQLEPQNLNEPL